MFSRDSLLAREQIKEVIYLYCQGVDRQDWGKVRTCFTKDAMHDHGTFEGDNDAFIGFAADVIKQMDGTLHHIGNILIDFDGDDFASSEASFVAYHRMRAGSKGPLAPIEDDTDWIVAGRYCDDWAKIGGVWKIKKRRAIHDWTRKEKAGPR